MRCHGDATDEHQLAGVTVTGFLFLFHLNLEKKQKQKKRHVGGWFDLFFSLWMPPALRSGFITPVTQLQTHHLFIRPRVCHTHTKAASVTAWRFMRRPGRNPKHTCGVFSHARGTGADLSSVMKYFLCVSPSISLSASERSAQSKSERNARAGTPADVPDSRPSVPHRAGMRRRRHASREV